MEEEIRFARRVSLRVKPDKINDFLSRMKEGIYPTLRKEDGMRRIYLLKDPGKENEFVSLTLWDSKSAADAYESSGHFSANRDKVRELLDEEPGVSQFEVEYHAVGPALPPPKPSKKKPRVRKARRRSSKRRRR